MNIMDQIAFLIFIGIPLALFGFGVGLLFKEDFKWRR